MKYIIQNVIGQGYWAEDWGEYKGFLFAEEYNSLDEAEKVANRLKETVHIIKIYK